MRLLASMVRLAAVSLVVCMPAAHAQPPETVLIQGQLLNDLGQPLTESRGYRVRFFDAETDGAQLGGDIVGQVIVTPQGLFAIPLVPPALVLEAPAAWYELAIDSSEDASGLTEADAFPKRIRVHSVPFARVAGQALSVEVEAIGGGAVTLEEFESLAGITGSVQSQLDAKADAAAVYTQAEVNALEAALAALIAAKADQAGVDDALSEKADLSVVLPHVGAAFAVVETTDNPLQNGANLLSAYGKTALLKPNGQPLSAGNRAVVIVPPGKYDLGSGQLVMNTPFVDLVGSTTARENHHIFGTSNGQSTGVLRQTADHVRIENLFVECTHSNGLLKLDSEDPAAYFPDSGLENTAVRNCHFLADDTHALSMRIGIEYAGEYEHVVGGAFAFGGGSGTASGTFRHCTGGFGAFGGWFGTASGDFMHCTGGTAAFGGDGGSVSGLFIHCIGGSSSFGSGGGGNGARFYFCIGGPASFTTSGGSTVVYAIRGGVAYP